MASEILTPTSSSTSRYVFSSHGSLIRPSRVWNDSSSAAASYNRTSLAAFATTTTSRTKALESVVETLQWSGLPGPITLISDREYLGQGSQFAVYKQRMAMAEYKSFSTRDVAIKQPKFDLDPDAKLDLVNSEARKHLHDIYLEIFALTNPALWAHPNIARLLGWSTEPHRFHSPPMLVMELAESNLATLLADDAIQISYSQKYSICYGIGAGLDALHDCRLVHGDLKPENILIFRHKGRIIAKLADFGLSVDEAESGHARAHLSGTPGWQAPEVEIGSMLNSDGLLQADNYSFGLLVWSIMLHSGKVPPLSGKEARQVIARRELENARDVIGLEMYPALADIVQMLLEYDSHGRPLRVTDLLDDRPQDEETGSETSQDSDYILNEYEDIPSRHTNFEYLSWEMGPLSNIFVDGLYSRLLESPRDLPGDILFAMFLAFTISPPSSSNSENRALNTLVVAALYGYEPAQSVVPAAHEFFQLEPQIEVKEYITGWLKSAVASGSTLAKPELEKLDLAALYDAISEFRSNGGYNRLYCAIDPSFSDTGAPQIQGTHGINFGYSHVHWLATYGTLPGLLGYFNTNEEYQTDRMTDNQETPLYLACARGSWEIAAELLHRGACPSIKCTSFEITCMHWIFAFDKEFQAEAVVELKRRDADLNALTSQEVPFLHYPFMLPAGTPLHWAVVTSSHTTVQALVEQGADFLIRDGSDPYVYDDRVRILNKFGGPDREPYSFSEIETQGLSPLDLAAMQHNAFIFELLASLQCDVDINAVDEDGFSVLHRLSASHIRRTRTGNAFSTLPFQGSRTQMRDNLRRTVAAIKALGADMELLTTSAASKAQRIQGAWNFPSRTPLMLAVMNSATDVVRTLLEAGASVHTENEQKETALLCLPEDDATGLEYVRLLVSYGADINHSGEFGTTAILIAAHVGFIDVVEFCLSKGADIDERERNPNAAQEGANLFHFLAREDEPFQEEIDLAVARLLERYVFTCPDLEKKRRVIEVGNLDGETLLHRFASRSMPHCVDKLACHGAPINALHKVYTRNSEGDVVFKISWHETPLDAATCAKEERNKRMERDRPYSNREYENLSQRNEAVIAILRRAGGVLALKEVVKKPFVFDKSRYGEGGMRIALQNC